MPGQTICPSCMSIKLPIAYEFTRTPKWYREESELNSAPFRLNFQVHTACLEWVISLYASC